MKVFGVGLSRTGTTTLSETLKYRLNIVHYPSIIDMYSGVNDGACDIPVVLEYKKLDKTFKNSKFVYTVRDIDEWLNSVVPYFERKRSWNMNADQVRIRTQVYGDAFPNREQARETYIRHDNDVRNYFKERKNDFLILDIIGGDSPRKLFDFLELGNAPDAFPVTNRLKK